MVKYRYVLALLGGTTRRGNEDLMHTLNHAAVSDTPTRPLQIVARQIPAEELSITVLHDEPYLQIVQEGIHFVGEAFGQAISLLELKETAATYNLVVGDVWFVGVGHMSITFREVGVECC